MHYIIIGLGSAGDVHPNVGLGVALRKRGHRVTLVAASVFRDLAAQAGLEFFGLGKDEDHYDAIRNPDLWDPMKAFPLVARLLMLPAIQPIYDFIAQNYVAGETVVAAPATAFGARIAQEKLGVPLASVHLQPSMLRSVLDPPTYMLPDILRPLPKWLRQLYFRAVDRFLIDKLLGPETNAFRAKLSLPPVRSFFGAWLHSPQLVIGLFPDWFAPAPADWPVNFHHAGFPLWDESDVRPPSAELQEFLAAGEPPYVFTAGSAMMHGHEFFDEAVGVCVKTGRRGILIAKYAEQIPPSLPPAVRHFDYVPFSQVLPRAAAFVHHGGIGTTAQAFAAGVPQVATPLAHDQFDNAMRIRKSGCGDFLLPKQFKRDRAAALLERLRTSPQVRAACEARADALRVAQPIVRACDLLESLAQPARASAAGN